MDGEVLWWLGEGCVMGLVSGLEGRCWVVERRGLHTGVDMNRYLVESRGGIERVGRLS